MPASEDAVLPAAKGMKAGSSSSSSELSSDCPAFLDVYRGRRSIRLWMGYLGAADAESESEDEADGEVVSSGEERGAGRGKRIGAAWLCT